MEPNKAQQTADQVDQKLMSHLAPLEKELNAYFYEKAPRLPKELSEVLVMIAPYVTIVGVILYGLALLLMLGISFIALPLWLLWAFAAPSIIPAAIYIPLSIVSFLLMLASIPGLMARSKSGWNFMFYGTLWHGIIDLVTGNWLSLILGLIVSFYFLFQLRPFYVHALAAPKAENL